MTGRPDHDDDTLDGGATTFVASATDPTPELAWAFDADEPPPDQRPFAWGIAALALAATALGVAVTAAGWMIFRHGDAAPTTVAAPVTSTVTIQAAPPPPAPTQAPPATWGSTAPKPQADPPATPRESVDEQFLNRQRADGWTITNQTKMLTTAHEICRRLKQGETVAQINQELAASTGMNTESAVSFSTNVILSYPDC